MTDGDPQLYYRKEETMPPAAQDPPTGTRPLPPGTSTPAGTAAAPAPATDPSATQPAGPAAAATMDNPPTRTTPVQSAPGQPVTSSAVVASGNYAAARQLIVNQPQKYDAVIRALERARGEIDQQIQALRNDRDAHAALIAQGL